LENETWKFFENKKGRINMLKNIPAIISPGLLKALMEMGHGDEIVIADGNYPAESAGNKVIRADGLGIPELLKAILQFFPLDTYADINVIYMDTGNDEIPSIWNKYQEILKKSKENFNIGKLERFKFYERASQSYCVVASSEQALYANIILKKGVIK
jgi:L-fucose mutarotase